MIIPTARVRIKQVKFVSHLVRMQCVVSALPDKETVTMRRRQLTYENVFSCRLNCLWLI